MDARFRIFKKSALHLTDTMSFFQYLKLPFQFLSVVHFEKKELTNRRKNHLSFFRSFGLRPSAFKMLGVLENVNEGYLILKIIYKLIRRNFKKVSNNTWPVDDRLV